MSLKYVAAYLMAVAAGNESPSGSDIHSILGSIGADVEDSILNKLINEMAGKTTHEVIAAGMAKLQAVPTGGAASTGASAGAAAATTAGGAAEAAKEEPEEEEPEEEEDMGFSLFD